VGRARHPWRRTGLLTLALVGVVSSVTPAHAQPGPISLSPARGPVGASVTITGTGLATATAVSFGNVAATFTVDGDDQLTTVVPAGATNAQVTVDTPDGQVVSDQPFVVQPNIVVILTDDQRWDTLSYMPTVESELVAHGVDFMNAFAENPLCCPSRASFLTGQDSHTTGVYSNQEPLGGFARFDDTATLGTWLDDAGYATFLTGKYLNHYFDTDGLYVPPGWDRWRAFASSTPYYDYDISLDGTAVESYGSDPSDYSTDVIAGLADDMIREASAQDPLFMWVAPLAPHGPWTPAPRDVGTLDGIDPWRPPSYDEADVRDKPAYIQALPRLSTDAQASIDALRQGQLETLGAVDDLVGTLLTALTETGRMSDTIFVFTSDNGYLWGEHRRDGKVVPYEESIRIPLVVRWDRVTGAGQDSHLISNTDLAPTLIEAGDATASGFDGMSFMPLLIGQSVTWRKHMLIEHDTAGAPSYCADRTPKEIFVHYATGEEEYYRLGPHADKYERTNKVAVTKFQPRITKLRNVLRGMCSPLPPDLPAF
jgi:N-acetylglucosamine-6-sulfatase